MEHKQRSISVADQIFEKLGQDSLSGKYSRGAILTEMKLSEELGVSRTPIREALRRLSQERIIEEVSKGSRVLGISTEDLEDIFKIRLNIEGTCAAMTAKNITDEQLSELREVVDMQEITSVQWIAVSTSCFTNSAEATFSTTYFINFTAKPINTEGLRFQAIRALSILWKSIGKFSRQ